MATTSAMGGNPDDDDEAEQPPEFGFSVDVVGDKRKAARVVDGRDDDDSGDDAARAHTRAQKATAAAAAPSAKAAWQDDDDGHVTVSLADKHRLRKLRANETEDKVSGIELEMRLRARCVRISLCRGRIVRSEMCFFSLLYACQAFVNESKRKLGQVAGQGGGGCVGTVLAVYVCSCVWRR